jgi:hypothetical protein
MLYRVSARWVARWNGRSDWLPRGMSVWRCIGGRSGIGWGMSGCTVCSSSRSAKRRSSVGSSRTLPQRQLTPACPPSSPPPQCTHNTQAHPQHRMGLWSRGTSTGPVVKSPGQLSQQAFLFGDARLGSTITVLLHMPLLTMFVIVLFCTRVRAVAGFRTSSVASASCLVAVVVHLLVCLLMVCSLLCLCIAISVIALAWCRLVCFVFVSARPGSSRSGRLEETM